jgi:predicted amidohydrolase
MSSILSSRAKIQPPACNRSAANHRAAVGPLGGGLWSAGDSKIVAPDSRVLALANNRDEMLIHARLDLSRAGRQYARGGVRQPAFLRNHWKAMLAACRRQLAREQTELVDAR